MKCQKISEQSKLQVLTLYHPFSTIVVCSLICCTYLCRQYRPSVIRCSYCLLLREHFNICSRSEKQSTFPIVPYYWLIAKANRVKKKAKIRNQYNQVPHLTQDTIYGKVTKTQESQEISPFPAGDHKAARNRQDSITKTNMKHK